MLDALRRGIMRHAAVARVAPPSVCAQMSPDVHKKKLQADINRLSREQRMQVALAIVRLVGFEAFGAYNNGCFVDITEWTTEQVGKIDEIVQYCISTK